MHDSTQFQRTTLWQQRAEVTFFSRNEYLLADSAYALGAYLVVPFKKPRSGSLNTSQKRFNKAPSHLRIAVEHGIGMMKARWPGIDKCYQWLHKESGFGLFNNWVIAAAILHNFCILQNDDKINLSPVEESDEEDEDGLYIAPNHPAAIADRNIGHQRREELMSGIEMEWELDTGIRL